MYQNHLERIISTHVASTPLFIYFAAQSVHEPLQAPQEYIDMYPSNYAGSVQRRTFAAMVTAVDDVVGNITESMNRAGLWAETLLVFSTDNGGNLNSGGNNLPLRGGKFTFWYVPVVRLGPSFASYLILPPSYSALPP
jgi:arylsulfatase A-like enzyme